MYKAVEGPNKTYRPLDDHWIVLSIWKLFKGFALELWSMNLAYKPQKYT